MAWRLWPVIDAEYRQAESRPRYFWGFHVPVVAAFVAVLWLPPMIRWSGVDPRVATVLLGGQLVLFGLNVHRQVSVRAPALWSTIMATVNTSVIAGMAASTGRPHSPIWALMLVYMLIAAQAFGLVAYVVLLAAGVPFAAAAALHVAGSVPLADSVGPMAVIALVNVVAYLILGRVQEEQRRLRRALQAVAMDHERRRIADDLHTTVGAALTEVSLWLTVAQAARDRDALERASRRTREALLELRACVASMDQADATPETLERLVRARLDGLCEAAGIALELRCTADTPAVHAADVYHAAKLVHEAGLNAIRHGRPRRLSVAIAIVAERVDAIEVVDDGVGFVPDATPLGRGLVAIREHVQALGAELTVRSSPGAGTVIRVRRVEGVAR